MKNSFNIKLIKYKNSDHTYDLVLGEFDTLKTFNSFDFIHFNDVILSSLNPDRVKNIFNMLMHYTDKTFLIGDPFFRFTVPENKTHIRYEIISSWYDESSIPLYVINPDDFISRLVSIKDLRNQKCISAQP